MEVEASKGSASSQNSSFSITSSSSIARVRKRDRISKMFQSIADSVSKAVQPGTKSNNSSQWFNPETFVAQKREWAKHNKLAPIEWPPRLFEHFIVVGLPPTTDIKSVIADKEAKAKAQQAGLGLEMKTEQQLPPAHARGGGGLKPEVLLQYPEDKPLDPPADFLATFCFPHGVECKLLERTPSMSSLNTLMYDQRYSTHDDHSFVFELKVPNSDKLPLYGLCLYSEELVHRPPNIAKDRFPNCKTPLSRYLVSAPRCYCLVTHYPFFDLHFRVLQAVLGNERLERITTFTNELSEAPSTEPVKPAPAAKTPALPMLPTLPNQMPKRFYAPAGDRRLSTERVLEKSASGGDDRVASNAVASSSSGDGQPIRRAHGSSDSFSSLDPETPGRVPGKAVEADTALKSRSTRELPVGLSSANSEVAKHTSSHHKRTSSLSGRSEYLKLAQHRLQRVMETASAKHPSVLSSLSQDGDTGFDRALSPASDTSAASASTSGDSLKPAPLVPVALRQSPGNKSPTKDGPNGKMSLSSLEEACNRLQAMLTTNDDGPSVEHRVFSPGQWNVLPDRPRCSSLVVIHQYYQTPVPEPGVEIKMQLDNMPPFAFTRPQARFDKNGKAAMRNTVSAVDLEAAACLRHWTIAALCRTLSLDNVLLLITAILLEGQIVIFCPNLGMLSALVLACIPLIAPFSWQSTFLPVLPENMLLLTEAPTPFVLGMQYKTQEVRQRCSSVVRVNVYKNAVKNASNLPPLPREKVLVASLTGPYSILHAVGKEKSTSRPCTSITDVQRGAAEAFLQVLTNYYMDLFGNLEAHTITDVQTSERVSLLLKDSFVESFPPKDRPFVKQFVETQMFEEYTDAVIT